MKTFSLLLPQVRFMKTFSFRLPILKTFTLKKICCRKTDLWKRFPSLLLQNRFMKTFSPLLLPQIRFMKTFSFRCCCSLFYENVFISLPHNRFMKTFSSRNIYVNTYIHKYVNTYIHTGHIFLRREYSRKSGKILSKMGKSKRKWKKVRE